MPRLAFLLLLTSLASAQTGALPLAARPIPISDVRLLDGPLRQALAKNNEVLLKLSPDRLLAPFYEQAGLPLKAPRYGGWEKEDVAGHSLGHYLSAVSLAYAATGDPRFKERADFIVAEVARCQQKNGNGFVDGKSQFRPKVWDEIAAGKIYDIKRHGLNGSWVPWYTIHKVFAGLRDAHLYTGNLQAKQILFALSDWASAVTAKLTPEQMESMLDCEFGGMNEVLADAYSLSGQREHLLLAQRFYHRRVMEPLRSGRDELAGLHANTQIPKVIGEARLYELTSDPAKRALAENFWKYVLANYTYANGGNSDKEWFGQPRKLSAHMSGEMTETCNSYNMLKLATHLFSWKPRADLMDYYERVLWNQIYNSQDRKTGMYTYKFGLHGGWFQSFSDLEDSFWCCVGSGMENHSRYTEAVYFTSANALWVNLYLASEAKWKAKNVTIRQDTGFPDEQATTLRLQMPAPTRFTLHLRVPAWSKKVEIRVAGRKYEGHIDAGSYVAIEREWKNGETVAMQFPFSLRAEPTPDNPNRVAFFYGPVLLAGLLGAESMPPEGPYGKAAPTEWKLPNPPPVELTRLAEPLDNWLKPVKGTPLTFRTVNAASPKDLTLVPMWQSHFQRFTVYFDAQPARGTPIAK